MQVKDTGFSGLFVIEPDVYKDSRGFFFESYNSGKFFQNNIQYSFKQDNISKSVKNTIRGLHYQVGTFAQGKLCQVIQGEVLDVAVDIRNGSPTYGKYFSVILNEENHLQLWLPPGFAHGFSVLSETAIFMYKCTELYDKNSERAILYNDSDLQINWQVESPIVSEKDMRAPAFKEIGNDFYF